MCLECVQEVLLFSRLPARPRARAGLVDEPGHDRPEERDRGGEQEDAGQAAAGERLHRHLLLYVSLMCSLHTPLSSLLSTLCTVRAI